jgi:hypothetical protein
MRWEPKGSNHAQCERGTDLTLTHRMLSVAAAVLVTGALGATAFAQTSPPESVVTEESASTILTSGSFTACSANYSTTQPTSCGDNTNYQTSTGGSDPAITANDQSYSLLGWGQVADLSGLGDGWNVTETGNALTLTTVLSSQENPNAVGHYTLPTTVGASNPVIDPSAPSSEPTTGIVGATVNLPSGGTVLSCGAGEGMGVYDFDETLTYQVPASAYAGTYSTTLDVQVTENPPPA